MKALILAAGQGTRLQYLTAHRPKPMLPIHGKPLLQHTIEWLRQYDVHHIAVNLHHYPESIVDCFGDGNRLDVSLYYSYEATLLGTAGAAKRLENYLDETFVVVYGDVYTNLDLFRIKFAHDRHLQQLRETRRDNGSSLDCLTMALYSVPNPQECGLVETDAQGRVMRFVEKPPRHRVFTDQAFSGVMICEPTLLAHAPEQTPFDFGHDLIPKLLSEDVPLYAESLAAGEFVIDIGTLGGYLAALRIDDNRQPPLALFHHAQAS